MPKLDNKLLIIEKPETISFDDIHELLWKANTQNRKDGFIMSTSQMSGGQLEKRIGADGHCLVALLEGQLVGTLSLRYLNRKTWYAHGRIADYMLAAVLPECQGYHINSALSQKAFKIAKKDGCKAIELDTAENNSHAIAVYKHLGFKLVSYKANPDSDHYSVIMMKWFDKIPFPTAYIRLRFLAKKIMVRIIYTPDKKKRFRV